MKPLLEDALDKAEEAAKNPHDKAKAQAVQNALQNAKKPIEAFKKGPEPMENDFHNNKLEK